MASHQSNAAVHLVENETAPMSKVTNSAEQKTVPAEKKSVFKKVILPIILVAALAGGSYEGYKWWTDGRFMVSTDDAYIGGNITYISPKVSGYVRVVDVKANQFVQAGDPLVTLDNGDYEIALEAAKAELATQNLSLKLIEAQEQVAVSELASAKAKKLAAEAALHGVQQTQNRAKTLQSKDIASTSTLDNANIAVEQAQANIQGADAAIQSAVANIDATKAQYNQAESALKSLQLAVDKADRDVAFTVLRAPYDGIVGNLSVQEGDLVSPGVRLAALVPSEELFIDANFKETQIADIYPGQVVHIHVDALGEANIEGRVVSIAPASGSVFSLLPAENATGNFTKVTQRLPVRISIPKEALDTHRLMAGLSVVVDIDKRTTPNTTNLAIAK